MRICELKMRVIYQPSHETHSHFKEALYNDLGVYHIQRGRGIGGFFKGLFKTLVPIGKSILKTGFEIAKPHLQQAGKELIQKGTKAAVDKVEDFTKRKLNSKRKRKEPVDVFSN